MSIILDGFNYFHSCRGGVFRNILRTNIPGSQLGHTPDPDITEFITERTKVTHKNQPDRKNPKIVKSKNESARSSCIKKGSWWRSKYTPEGEVSLMQVRDCEVTRWERMYTGRDQHLKPGKDKRTLNKGFVTSLLVNIAHGGQAEQSSSDLEDGLWCNNTPKSFIASN